MPGYEFDMKMEFASPDHHQTTGIDAIMVGSTPRLYPRPGTGEWTYPSDDLNAPRSYIPIGRGIHAREGFQQPLAGTAYGAGGNFVPRYTGSTGIHTDAWNPMPMVDSPPQGYGYANGSGIDMAAEWNVAILGTPPMKLVVPLTPLLPSASPQDMDSQDGFGSTVSKLFPCFTGTKLNPAYGKHNTGEWTFNAFHAHPKHWDTDIFTAIPRLTQYSKNILPMLATNVYSVIGRTNARKRPFWQPDSFTRLHHFRNV